MLIFPFTVSIVFLGRSVLCPCRVCLWCAGLPGVCLNEGGKVCAVCSGVRFFMFFICQRDAMVWKCRCCRACV